MTKRMYYALAVAVVVLLPIVALAAMRLLSTKPDNLGVRDGRLAPCPATPNCVCTQCDDAEHRMDPIPFDGDVAGATNRLKAALAEMTGIQIVEEQPGYLRAEATSRLFRFVDDVEFYLNAQAGQIHFRSASRAGRSDFGVNRARMKAIAMHLRQPPVGR